MALTPSLVDAAERSLLGHPGVGGVRSIRVRWLGHTLHAEADIEVDAGLRLTESHDIAHHAEAHLLHDVPRLSAAVIHTSPAGVHQHTH